MKDLSELQQWFSELHGPYQLRVSQTYTPEMDWLRLAAFPEAQPFGTDQDPYDIRAWHLTINHTNRLAGYGRLIPGPDGCFAGWTASPFLINTAQAADSSRWASAESFTGCGLPDVIGPAHLLLAQASGFRYVHGAVRPGRRILSLLTELGFRAVHNPINATEHHCNYSLVLQLITCDLTALTFSLQERIRSAWEDLRFPSENK